MRQCLTSPDGGYYTNGKDPFGQKGDFVTSPEISQIFGELLGIWMVAEWMAQGKIRQGVEIIEVGPGRGTLMDDMLRVWYDAMNTNNLKDKRADVMRGVDFEWFQSSGISHRANLPGRSKSHAPRNPAKAFVWRCAF